jgi:3-hydroxyisobutyrate dehydrogenase-like beta-hydroxyacid dehydrogenase
MGRNMAHCLKDKGYTVIALFDINDTVANELDAEIGATSLAKPEPTRASSKPTQKT